MVAADGVFFARRRSWFIIEGNFANKKAANRGFV